MVEAHRDDIEDVDDEVGEVEAFESGAELVEFDYESFLRRMRHPSCRPLITQLKNFISYFQERSSTVSVTQIVHQYRDFIDRLMLSVHDNAVWRLRGEAHPEEWELAREGIEYLLMNQLYSTAFAPKEDRDRDQIVARKMSLYGEWMQARHLDIKGPILDDELLLDEAIIEFRKINEYLTPRDKLIYLVESCSPDASADEIMPIQILAILKSKVSHFHSNLQYVSRYRDQRKLASDSAYHFTSLLAVSSFIERMDQQSLVISDEEFNERMEEANRQNVESASEFVAEPRRSDPLPTDRRQDQGMSQDQFKEEATKVYISVKEKVKLGASKSIDYLGKLMTEAEAKIKAAISSGSASPAQEEREQMMRNEDEFQLQLAMALSLSEQECRANNLDKSAEKGQLIEIQDPDHQERDSKSSSTEPS
ncbi:Vps9p [Paramicrosporidium saccamoebae]|uniref:Vps9p n=1 Tax=Paramicrosporidium saccamoebae TaxID=1246581 RepID=A0A2H9TFH5_9FUNG|nr:Vps9p [Paramicrosporidium saccamoebae]